MQPKERTRSVERPQVSPAVLAVRKGPFLAALPKFHCELREHPRYATRCLLGLMRREFGTIV
jgi:hypothetical protein